MRLVVLSLLAACSYKPPGGALDPQPGDGTAPDDTLPVDAPLNAWLDGWSHRKSITIDRTKVSAPSEGLSDFPVAIQFPADLEIDAIARADGADLAVTGDDAMTPQSIELERYADGAVTLWVKVPVLKNDADTRLYLYYGNSQPPPVTPEQVWSNHFVAVWHLNQSPATGGNGDIKDATAGNHDGTADQSMSDNDLFQLGFVGPALRFDGGNEFIRVPSAINLGDNFTISTWLFRQGGTTGIETVFSSSASGPAVPGCRLFVNSDMTEDKSVSLETSNGTMQRAAKTAGGSITNQRWTHVAAVVDRANGTAKIFIDGQDRTQVEDVVTDFPTNQSGGTIARMVDEFTWIGRLDELEIASEQRSSDWIETAFRNQGRPDTFFAIGPQESDPR